MLDACALLIYNILKCMCTYNARKYEFVKSKLIKRIVDNLSRMFDRNSQELNNA